MCDNLLYTHRFSVSAISNIYKTAKQYGEPIEVLNALNAYERVKAIEREIAHLGSRKNAMESSYKEIEKQTQNLEIKRDSLKEMRSHPNKPGRSRSKPERNRKENQDPQTADYVHLLNRRTPVSIEF